MKKKNESWNVETDNKKRKTENRLRENCFTEKKNKSEKNVIG